MSIFSSNHRHPYIRNIHKLSQAIDKLYIDFHKEYKNGGIFRKYVLGVLFNSIILTFISNNDASSVQAFRLSRICLSKDLTPSSILCFFHSNDLIKGKDNSILRLPFGPCCWLFLCLFLSKFSHWCSSADSSRSSSPLVPPLSGSVTTCSGANSSWQKKKKILQFVFLLVKWFQRSDSSYWAGKRAAP